MNRTCFSRAVGTLLLVLCLSLTAGMRAEEPALPVSSEVTKLGVYILEIRDLNPADGTFAAEFWIWSQAATDADILGRLEFLNADRVSFHSESKGESSGIYWTKRRAAGTFRLHWDMKRFPFDSQQLEILTQYNGNDAGQMVLKPDTENSGFPPELAIGGWKIDRMEMTGENVVYNSSLGNPALSGRSVHPLIAAVVDITRTETSGYWKLMAAAYVAMIMCLVSFLLDFETPGPRYGLIGAGMFAAVINFRSAGIALGADGTLVDRLHLLILGFLALSLFLTLLFNALARRGVAVKNLRFANGVAFLAAAVIFIGLNMVLYRQVAG